MPPLLLLLVAAVPDVMAGPDLADQARIVDAPIAQVTVFSDRARVRRRVTLPLSGGPEAIRLPDLPGGILLDTVRLAADGATVLRIEATPVQRPRVSIAQADALLAQFDVIGDELAQLGAERSVLQSVDGILAGITPAPPVPEHERKIAPVLAPEIWRRALALLAAERAAIASRVWALELAAREKNKAAARIQAEIRTLDLGGFSDRRVQVLAMVDASKGQRATLELEYFVPGALWRPAYGLRFEARDARITLHTAGRVTQASGEDWNDVELELSTAIPGQNIDIPELLTWTLGEARELIPRYRPRTPPPTPQIFGAPTTTGGEEAAKSALLQHRLRQLQKIAQLDPSAALRDRAEKMSKDGDGVGDGWAGSGSAYEPPAPPPMPPQPQPPLRRSSARVSQDRASVKMESAPSAQSSILEGFFESSSDDEHVAYTPLDLFETSVSRAPRFADVTLPAVTAGGLDYVYRVPAKVTVPSEGQDHEVPLSTESVEAKTYYEATPALAETAYLEATVINSANRPILAGPVSIFVNDHFTGEGRLATTGPGGAIELPLGADEDIRLNRKVIPHTERKGLISKSDLTTYRVVIEVASYKKKAVDVVIVEPIPLSGNADAEVKLVSTSPAAKTDAKEGIITWKLSVPAGKVRTVELVYTIERPADWQLRQR